MSRAGHTIDFRRRLPPQQRTVKNFQEDTIAEQSSRKATTKPRMLDPVDKFCSEQRYCKTLL